LNSGVHFGQNGLKGGCLGFGRFAAKLSDLRQNDKNTNFKPF